MQIREDHLDAFRSQLLHTVDLAMANYIRRRFPTELGRIAESDLLELIAARRVAARQYGIEREDNVATFVDLSVMYGESFVDAEWARPILDCTSLHGPDKIALLRARVEESGASL